MVRRDFTATIHNAADLAECDVVAGEIVTERPDQIVLLFAQLHQRRAVLAKEAGEEAERDHGVRGANNGPVRTFERLDSAYQAGGALSSSAARQRTGGAGLGRLVSTLARERHP